MPIRLRTLAATMMLLASAPLAAQSSPASSTGARPASPVTTFDAPPMDSRLLVDAVERRDASSPRESEPWKDVVTRPWWHYPAIGAAIGAGAGLIHANAIMQGDYVGFPLAEPNVLLPVAYGAVGAFLGVLVDSSERERAARR